MDINQIILGTQIAILHKQFGVGPELEDMPADTHRIVGLGWGSGRHD